MLDYIINSDSKYDNVLYINNSTINDFSTIKTMYNISKNNKQNIDVCLTSNSPLSKNKQYFMLSKLNFINNTIKNINNNSINNYKFIYFDKDFLNVYLHKEYLYIYYKSENTNNNNSDNNNNKIIHYDATNYIIPAIPILFYLLNILFINLYFL